MVYAIVTIGVLQVVFDILGLWMARRYHGQSIDRIAILERENLQLANGVVAAKKSAAGDWVESHDELEATVETLNQRLLTLENKQPKIASRPKRVNFREFRDAAERASEPEEAD